jgi:hypothetical protein
MDQNTNNNISSDTINNTTKNFKRKFSQAFPEADKLYEEIITSLSNLETHSKLHKVKKVLNPNYTIPLNPLNVNKKEKITKADLLSALNENYNNNVHAALKLGCSEGKIRYLKQELLNEDELNKLKRKPSRRHRKATYYKLDNLLFKWFMEQRNKKLAVNYHDLSSEAKKIANDLSLGNFKCSLGYLQAFKKRNKMSLRKSTHFMQKCTDSVLSEIAIFIKHLLSFKIKKIQSQISNIMLEESQGSEPIYVNMVNA